MNMRVHVNLTISPLLDIMTFSSPLRMRQGQPPASVVSAVFLGLLEHRWILELGAKEGRAALEHFHTSLGMFQSSG